MNETEKLLQDQFMSLPLKTQEAIGRVPWKEKIKDIANKENLSDDQRLNLEVETALVLYSLSPAEDLMPNIQSQVGLDEKTSQRILAEIATDIMDPIELQYEIINATTPLAQDHQINISKPEQQPVSHTSEPPSNLPIVEETELVPMVVPKKETTYQSTINKLFVRPTTPAQDSPKETPTPNPSVLSEPKLEPKPKIEEKMPEAPKISYPNNKDPYREPLE